MIRKLLATTALITLISGAAFAQEATTTTPVTAAPSTGQSAIHADGVLASNLIGETVYNGTGDDAQNIGDVNDVVIDANGSVKSIIIGVGGFLGLGEKNVAFDYSAINWAERNGDRWIVVNATKEQLLALTEFDASQYGPASAATASAKNSDAMKPDTSDNAMAPAGATADTTTTAAIDRSTLTEIPAGDIRAETLVGTTVYGAADANVGKIGDVVLTQDGKVDAVIIDVGGFLGIGAKEVAVGMDKLAFMTDEDGDKYLYTTFSKEQLNAAAAYDKATWADNRDSQMLRTQ